MTDKKTPAEAPKTAAPLGDAGASTNPLVHQALGELEIAERNRADLDVSDEDKARADEEIKAAKVKLKDLGVAL